MRKCILAPAAAALLLLAAAALGGQPTAATIDVYTGVVLTADVDHEVRTYIWFVNAPDRSWVPVVAEEGGRRVRFATGDLTQQGRYLVLLVAIAPDGLASQAVGEFVIGDAEPPVPPPPPPPGPVEHLMVLVLTDESDEQVRPGIDARPADWNYIVRSPRIWEWLKANGHHIEVRDVDTEVEKTNVPGGLAPWVQRLGDGPRPHVFFLDCDTADCLADVPVPGIAEETDELFFELVKKWGAEHAAR